MSLGAYIRTADEHEEVGRAFATNAEVRAPEVSHFARPHSVSERTPGLPLVACHSF